MADSGKDTSRRATSYKRRSMNIEKRTLRGLNRTLEQKEKRAKEVNRRRKTLSAEQDSIPEMEEGERHENSNSTNESVFESQENKPKDQAKTKSKADSRKEMLEKWRKEKELKKKLEAQKKRRPEFKVFHAPDTNKITQKLAPVHHQVAATAKVATKLTPDKLKVVTESLKRVTRSTRSAVPSSAQKAKAPVKPSTNTSTKSISGRNSTISKPATTHEAKKSSTATTTRHQTSNARGATRQEPQAPVRSFRKTVGSSEVTKSKPIGKISPKKDVPVTHKGPMRSTRSMTASVPHLKKQTDTKKGKGDSSKRVSTPVESNIPAIRVRDLDNTPLITRKRGGDDGNPSNTLVFPAVDFSFKAPENLTPFEFNPLSPGSANSFLYPNGGAFRFSPAIKYTGRCSTPKVHDLATKESVIVSPAASIIKEVDSTDSETEPEVKKKRRSSVRKTPVSKLTEKMKQTPKDATPSSKRNRSDATSLGPSSTLAETLFTTASEDIESCETTSTTRRRSRRISGLSPEAESSAKKSIRRKRRSTFSEEERSVDHREESTQLASAFNEDKDGSEEKVLLGKRRSSRRSVSGGHPSITKSPEQSPLTRRKSLRRSVDSLIDTGDVKSPTLAETIALMTEANSSLLKKTPVRAKGKRKSFAVATPRLSDIPEPAAEPDDGILKSSTSTEARENAVINTVEESNKELAVEDNIENKQKKKVTISDDNKDLLGSSHTVVINSPLNTAEASIFKTPASLPCNRQMLAARRKTAHSCGSKTELSASASKNTPRSKNRTSLILRHLSPEDGCEILKNSPMIEMGRRKKSPKTPVTPGLENRIEPINFDDIDDSLNASLGASSSQEAETLGPISIAMDFTDKTEDKTITTTISEKSNKSDVIDKSPVSSEMREKPSEAIAQPSAERDVQYFKDIVVSTVAKLNELCNEWEAIRTENPQLSEDLQDQIRMVIGKGQLLISKKGRFTQFSNLVEDCEHQRGEQKTTVEDIQGFHEMVNFQVEDVYTQFEKLRKLKENNWEEEKPKLQPKKKIIKKKTVGVKSSGGPAKPAVKSKFAEFRAKMKKQQEEKTAATSEDKPKDEKQDITFEGGFFQVNSPVRNEAAIAERLSLKDEKQRLSSKPSTPKRNSRSPSCASPLLLHSISKRSRSIGTGLLLSPLVTSADNSFTVNTSGAGSRPGSSLGTTVTHKSVNTPLQPTTPGITAASIFTPEESNNSTPRTANRRSVRRSKRLSVQPLASPITKDTAAKKSPVDMMKYLQPSNTVSGMDIDANSTDDVDMAATMKRGLISEFDNADNSIHFESPATRGSSIRQSASKRRSSLSHSRRSVHFDMSAVDLLKEEDHSVAPTTPFNRDSLVPRRRTHSGRHNSISEQKENLLFTPPVSSPSVPKSESPATRMSKLTFDTDSPMSTIFTPPQITQKSIAPENDAPVADLIDLNFSPLNPVSTNGQSNKPTPYRSRRKSNRISLL